MFSRRIISEFREFIPGDNFEVYMEGFENYLDINEIIRESMQKKPTTGGVGH